jgi:hypothetical protein
MHELKLAIRVCGQRRRKPSSREPRDEGIGQTELYSC